MKKRAKKSRPKRHAKKRSQKKRPADEVSKEAAAKIERIIAAALARLENSASSDEKPGSRLGNQLVRAGSISQTDLTNFLSKQYNVPSINLAEFDVDAEVTRLVTRATCEKHLVLPVNRAGKTLIVAMADPANIFAIDDLKFLTGLNVEPVVATREAILTAIARFYPE